MHNHTIKGELFGSDEPKWTHQLLRKIGDVLVTHGTQYKTEPAHQWFIMILNYDGSHSKGYEAQNNFIARCLQKFALINHHCTSKWGEMKAPIWKAGLQSKCHHSKL